LSAASCVATDAALGADPGTGPVTASADPEGDLMPIAEAAIEAVDTAGTEVSRVEVDGPSRGPLGLWVVLRRLPGVPSATDAVAPTGADSGADAPADR